MTVQVRKSISALPRIGHAHGVPGDYRTWYHFIVSGVIPHIEQGTNGRWTFEAEHEAEIIEAYAKLRGLKITSAA
jgi:hypothetical protein